MKIVNCLISLVLVVTLIISIDIQSLQYARADTVIETLEVGDSPYRLE